MSSIKPITILLIEDDMVAAEAVKRALKARKIVNDMLWFQDAHQAIDLLQERGGWQMWPCVVLLDLNLPGMDGIEFLEYVRKDPKLNDLVIFVLTTSNSPDDKRDAYRYNVAGYIVKDKAGEGFDNLVHLLNLYWCVVDIPAVG